MEGSPEDSVFTRRDGGKRVARKENQRGICPPGRSKSSEVGSKFGMAERPNAQAQDSGVPEGYQRQELFRKRERRRAMEGSPEDSVFRKRDGGKRLSRKEN